MQLKFSKFINKNDVHFHDGVSLNSGAKWDVVGINNEGRIVGKQSSYYSDFSIDDINVYDTLDESIIEVTK